MDKLEQMSYIADQRNIELPENFPNYKEESYFEDYISCMRCLDTRFEEKFHFYVSREQVNYEHLDNFLNIHLLRFWPQINKLMMSKIDERKLREINMKKEVEQERKNMYHRIVVNSNHQ